MKYKDRKICPNCEKLLWYNYCKNRWECRIDKDGCGYPDKNINLQKDKRQIVNRSYVRQLKRTKYSCPACNTKNYPSVVIKDLVKLGCKRCGKHYSLIQKTL